MHGTFVVDLEDLLAATGKLFQGRKYTEDPKCSTLHPYVTVEQLMPKPDIMNSSQI